MTWKKRPLGEVASIDRSGIPPESIRDGTIYVGLENMTGDGTFLDVRQVENGELASTKFTFNENHVLFGKLRPYLRKTTRPNFKGVCSTDILPILAGPDLNRDFLYHFLRLPETVTIATTRSAGANLPRISPRILEEFEIPVPSLPEQKRIAELLDKADALRQKRRLALQKLDSLLQSVFFDIFGDPHANPKEWDLVVIGDLVEETQTCNPTTIADCEFEYIDISSIDRATKQIAQTTSIDATSAPSRARQLVRKGDVIVSTVRPNLNAVARVPEHLDGQIASTGFTVLRPRNPITSHFLFEWVKSEKFVSDMVKQATGASYPAVSDRIVKGSKILRPPIELQSTFSDIAEKIATIKDSFAFAAANNEELFDSIQQRAFAGNLFYDN